MLDRLLENLQLHPAQTVVRLHLQPQSLGDGRALSRSSKAGGVDRRIEAQNCLSDRQPAERLAKIVGLALIRNGRAAQQRAPCRAITLRSNPSNPVVRIRLIKLQHGEFGIVAGG
jgi:hypothetical protein